MSLSSQWLGYALRVLPAGAPEVQRTELRRAFYAGAAAFYQASLGALDPAVDGLPNETELAAYGELVRELESFGRDVERGRA